MIQFNKASFAGSENDYMKKVTLGSNLGGNGDGEFSQMCQTWIEECMGNGSRVFLTTSCTSSLELASLLIDIQVGDEVILPSFTFVSTANAFILRGATPVMVDIDAKTMNIDHTKIEAAITKKTKAIVPVHYGGVACEMDHIMALASQYNLKVIEDAAQSLTASFKSRPLGSIGHIGCFSFHETKNFTSGGKGGAIVINDPTLATRAEIIYDNGTNMRAFLRGDIKGSFGWVDIGSNFIMPEIQAAYLWAQLEIAEKIARHRFQIWEAYNVALQPLCQAGNLEVAQFDHAYCKHNAHMYFIKLKDAQHRRDFVRYMWDAGIICSPHYVPLHHSPVFQTLGRFVGADHYTSAESVRLVRLPLYEGLSPEDQLKIIQVVKDFFWSGSS